MVKPNKKIYTVVYFTPELYSVWDKPITDLAKRFKTKITYNFEEQYFNITGNSQDACENSAKKIRMLIDQLTRGPDLDLKTMAGTYDALSEADLDQDSKPSSASISRSSSYRDLSSPELTRITGRPLNLESSNKNAYYGDTESDGSEDDEFVETFTFAKNISNPREVLTGQVAGNMQATDYLRVIGRDTGTECSLQKERQIKIVGSNLDQVKEALCRFQNLQKIYKRRKRGTNKVACVHYSVESPPFSLYFCNIDRYDLKKYVHMFGNMPRPLFVLLPVFKNSQGKHEKPKGLLDPPKVTPQWMAQPPQQQLDERMKYAAINVHQKHDYSNPYMGSAPDNNTLWGENKRFVTRTNAPSSRASSGPSSGPSTPTKSNTPVTEEYPALATKPKKAANKTPTRRVVRLPTQKSAKSSKGPKKSQLDITREYNFYRMKTALEDGLNDVRGFKGIITLSARMGKVLWTKVEPDIQKRIWEFESLNDVLIKEHGITPMFNNITTTSDEVMERISDMLPSSFSKSAVFEIHAKARNQPILPYQPVIMYMSQGVVELKKVVASSNAITEINWCSLERKYDFQLALKTEEVMRSDVKPFSTFIKKVSVSPHTRQITYENVPDFLEVDYILLKQITKYRIHFPFVVEITRVEKLPLIKQKNMGYNIDKILGDTGKGEVWYDFEIFYTVHDQIFKSNLDLPIGKLAPWNVDDVLGSGASQSNALVEYIRCLLLFVERCEELAVTDSY